MAHGHTQARRFQGEGEASDGLIKIADVRRGTAWRAPAQNQLKPAETSGGGTCGEGFGVRKISRDFRFERKGERVIDSFQELEPKPFQCEGRYVFQIFAIEIRQQY